MTRRDHGVFAALACVGLLLALYQCWYVYLPPNEAALLDFCRFNQTVDCYESLNRFGHTLRAWIVPAFPALAGLFFWQAALCVFGWTGEPRHREAWLAAARVLAFPVAGLALFILLNDYMVAKATSASAVLVGVIAVVSAVLAVRHGLEGANLRAGAGWTLLLGVAGVLLGYFLHGAGSARREIAELTTVQETRPPLIRWSEFAKTMPRTGAARVGNPLAETEVLLFLDPAHPSYATLLAEAAALEATDVVLHVYGDAGLVAAQRAGTFPKAAPVEKMDRVWHTLHERARTELGIERPAAVWKSGRKTGSFTLAEVIAAARQ